MTSEASSGARQLGPAGKAVPVHMHQQQPAAAVGGDYPARDRRHRLERGAKNLIGSPPSAVRRCPRQVHLPKAVGAQNRPSGVTAMTVEAPLESGCARAARPATCRAQGRRGEAGDVGLGSISNPDMGERLSSAGRGDAHRGADVPCQTRPSVHHRRRAARQQSPVAHRPAGRSDPGVS